MRVAFIQMQPEFGRKDENIDKAIALMSQTSADLYVLPELFATGYVFISPQEASGLAEPARTGQTARRLGDFAKTRKSGVVFGFAEAAAEGNFNSCAFVSDIGDFRLYRKLHLFFKEKTYFAPGNLPLEVFSFREARLGMMICFDWIFPEVARSLSVLGADIICHPVNLVMSYCQDSMRARSIENHIYTVTANRVGTETRGEDSFKFTGKSQITDCYGNIIFRAGEDKEAVFTADIIVEEARNKDLNALNNLMKDRRTEFYGPLVEE